MRILLAASLLLTLPVFCAEESLGFNADIRPLLSDRCFACHGFDAKAREADLRLDDPEAAYSERDGVIAIVPGNPTASAAWQRIISTDSDEVMPPSSSHLSLSAAEKSLLKRWIEEGAKYEKHWTFVPPEKPELSNQGAHPIDVLVAERLEQEGLELSPEADRRTLIRRVSFDLRGIPPSPEEVEAFISDRSAGAWKRVVDRFLADPAFGERMAWPWLDAARYADTNGYQGDHERTMWPWRDWVIDAFNRNLPYDKFTVWQIAGDLIPDATFEQKLASGFLRNHAINGEGGRIPEENRVDYVMDMSETAATVWMGLTTNCCRCHDHKYDPITQREYYGLFDFFNQTPVDGSGKNPQTPPTLATPSETQRDQEKQLTASVKQLTAELAGREKELVAARGAEGNEDQKQRRETFRKEDPTYAAMADRLDQARARLDKLRKAIPKVMIMGEQKERRPSYILAVGSYESPGEEVRAHTPAILPPLDVGERPANRLDFARWLVAREHPLTSRVTVNRLWQEFFGIGLIKSPEDLGVQSEIPKHPRLLDWLAVEFMESGWDFKALVRSIVTSRTYCQSSRVSAELLAMDPANRLLARGPRFRQPAWMIRDQALAASGLLVPQVGGEPVKPWQPEGLWAEVTFGGGKKIYKPDTGDKLRRRSLYTFWRRISAPPMFFDNAKRETCEVGVSRTNSPLHALSTLNDPLYAEAARALASRAARATPDEKSETILARAFALALVRPPSESEMETLRQSYRIARASFEADPASAAAFLAIGETPADPTLDPVTHASLASVCLSILNTDEALTKE